MKKMSRPKSQRAFQKRYNCSTGDWTKTHHSSRDISITATPDDEDERTFPNLTGRRNQSRKKYPPAYGYRTRIVKNMSTEATPVQEEERFFPKKPKGVEKP